MFSAKGRRPGLLVLAQEWAEGSAVGIELSLRQKLLLWAEFQAPDLEFWNFENSFSFVTTEDLRHCRVLSRSVWVCGFILCKAFHLQHGFSLPSWCKDSKFSSSRSPSVRGQLGRDSLSWPSQTDWTVREAWLIWGDCQAGVVPGWSALGSFLFLQGEGKKLGSPYGFDMIRSWSPSILLCYASTFFLTPIFHAAVFPNYAGPHTCHVLGLGLPASPLPSILTQRAWLRTLVFGS